MTPDSGRDGADAPDQPSYLETVVYPELRNRNTSDITEFIQAHQAPGSYPLAELEDDLRNKRERLSRKTDLQISLRTQGNKYVPLTEEALAKLSKADLVQELISQALSRKAYNAQTK